MFPDGSLPVQVRTMTSLTSLISLDQFHVLRQQAQVVVVDARGGPDAWSRYQAGHLVGAVFADLESDLSAPGEDPAQGGRHPLPTSHQFAVCLARWGITPDSVVVVYDDKGGANAAARLWWMLRALGHRQVAVLDGGWQAIVASGLPCEHDPTSPKPSPQDYPARPWNLPQATIDQVAQAVQDPRQVVIDVRESFRYRGENEPIDRVAGHIPGAVNVPFVENLADDGRFLHPSQLEVLYRPWLQDRAPEEVIVHCGSGVTACHTLLALEQIGFAPARLYVGSWSEWSRQDRPIAP